MRGLTLARNRRKIEDPAMLLKEYGFNLKKATKLFVFSLFFSSIGVLVLAFWMQVSFYSLARTVLDSVNNTFISLNSIYSNDTFFSDSIIESRKEVFNTKRKIGPKDLTISANAPLVNVKGQKRQLSENSYEVRFVDVSEKK